MNKRNSTLRIVLLTASVALLPLLATACNSAPAEPQLPSQDITPGITATVTTEPMAVPTTAPVPEATTVPTATSIPDTTSVPTATPVPKSTQAPTVTPTPDTTQAPTATPTPVPTATPTPVPVKELPTPLFSKEGGFYQTAFSLTLSCEEDCEIYYTLDGSDPKTSKAAVLYQSAISVYDNTSEPNRHSAVKDITLGDYNPPTDPVDKGIIVRAVSKAKDGTFSEVITNSYFVGKTASYYTDMKVISLVTDSDYLFDPDEGAYVVGTDYYTWLNSDEYEYYETGDNRNPTNYNKDGRESEFPVNIQVFENGKAQYSADVGARISGNWSRSEQQKSIRLYARSEYGSKKMKYTLFGDDLTDATGKVIKKFDKVTLRNGGNDARFLHFRDALIQDLASGLAVDVMASEPYILFIDGEFWGFYLLREKPDGNYIESHYGIPEENVTVIKNGSLESGSEDYVGEYWAFCDWAKTVDMTVDTNYEKFCETIDVQSFMDYMAVETYVCNADWANGGLNNWMVWRSHTIDPSLPKADGKWRFIFYDLDFAANLYGHAETSYQYDCLGSIQAPYSDFSYPEILRNVIKNESFRQAFYENYLRIIDTCFDSEIVNAKITEYASAYGDATCDTYYRFDSAWAAMGYFDGISKLKEFFRLRPTYAKKYLNAYSNTGESFPEESVEGNLLPTVDSWSYYGTAEFSATPADNAFQASVPNATANVWDIQSQAGKFTLEANEQYILTFEASCSKSISFDIGINRYDGSGYPACFWTSTSITPEIKEYTFLITAEAKTYDNWNLCFNFGGGSGVYTVKNAVLKKAE